MDKLKIQPGDKFNYLTVIKESDPYKIDGKRPKRNMLCECICGRRIVARLDSLRNNKKSSCGCQFPINKELVGTPVKKHGLAYSDIYKIWKGVKGRCFRYTSPSYFRYGGRGICMSQEWAADPSIFYEWAVKNGYAKGLQLDRIDNNGGYFPENCRWVTSEVNGNNKRNNIKYEYNGEFLTLPQIARKVNIGFPTLYRRINVNKLSLQEAISIPLNGRCTKEEYKTLRKLSDKQVLEIYKSKEKIAYLCKKYGVHKSTIDRIRHKDKRGSLKYLKK